MIQDQKPGVIGAISNVGQAVKQGAQKELKKTIENTVEQITGGEKKEAAATAAVQAEAAKAQHSQDVANWLYGTSSESTPPIQEAPPPQPKPEGKAIDVKTQLGFGGKPEKTGDLSEQLGMKANNTNVAGNPMEQIMGPNTTQPISATEQLNFMPTPAKTPEEQQKQQQLKQQLHNQYYQGLTTPRKQPETEERIEEAREEQETAQQRMERLQQEDLQKKQEEEEKKQPIAVDQAQNMEKHRGSSG